MGDAVESVWKALADPTRRRILDLLQEAGQRTTGEVCAVFPLSRFAVMKHLAVLEEAGLIAVERRGRERLNRLDPGPLRGICGRWLRRYEPAREAAAAGDRRPGRARAARAGARSPAGLSMEED